jgi:hypothetical protein
LRLPRSVHRVGVSHRRCDVLEADIPLRIRAGPSKRSRARGGCGAGLAANEIAEVADRLEALDYLLARLEPGDVVLVKASRGIAMDMLVDELVAALGPRADEAPRP